MSTALDVALRGAVKAVAGALGTAVVVTVITAGVYSTATGGATDVAASTTVQGFVLEERDLDRFGLAKVGDRAVLVPAASLPTEPVATQDGFSVAGTAYAIVRVDRIRARDQAAAYVLHGSGPA